MSSYTIRLALRGWACSDVRHSVAVRCVRGLASIGAGICIGMRLMEGYKTNTLEHFRQANNPTYE